MNEWINELMPIVSFSSRFSRLQYKNMNWIMTISVRNHYVSNEDVIERASGVCDPSMTN